jgi:16S rRNA (guanine527-N7)-methyltransferase
MRAALEAAVARSLAGLPAEACSAAEEAGEELVSFLRLLLERNAAMNLVSARVAAPEPLAAHLADALFGLSFLPPSDGAKRRLLDVGSGGGFPAIPLLLVRRDLEGTLVDSVRKKCVFLADAASRLALTLDVVNARFPDSFSMATRPFDVLTTRAVSSAGRLVRAARPLLAPGARALLWTTRPLVREAVRDSRANASAFHLAPGAESRGVLVLERFT